MISRNRGNTSRYRKVMFRNRGNTFRYRKVIFRNRRNTSHYGISVSQTWNTFFRICFVFFCESDEPDHRNKVCLRWSFHVIRAIVRFSFFLVWKVAHLQRPLYILIEIGTKRSYVFCNFFSKKWKWMWRIWSEWLVGRGIEGNDEWWFMNDDLWRKTPVWNSE